jgi:enoyl-CoA hydratase/carnithine racemase
MKARNRVLWDKSGSIGIITLNNPPENYIEDPDFLDKGQLLEFLHDTALKGIIIKGAGRHFSAGANMISLKQLAQQKELLSDKIAAGKDVIQTIEASDIPVVAAISGVCFGAGLEIALACHIRICSENSLFAFPETNHGLMPGIGGSVMLTKLIGSGKSAEIILSGDIIDAQKALTLKLTDYIVPSKELQAFSLSYIERLTSSRDIDVIRSVMQSIHNAQTMPFEKALEEETKLFCPLAVKSMKYVQ